jgi:osmoprotectant transport system permease protein
VNVISEVLDWFSEPGHWRGGGGIPTLMLQHVLLTATSLAIALGIALPVALYLGHIGKGGALAINISNIGRAIPTFAVLILLAVGFVGSSEFGPYGRTGLATLIALVVFALPPIVTNAYVGMREVDKDTIEAARGMGMRGWQLFTQVELPLAVPLIMTGVRLAVVQVWATATLAALVDGPGLGNIIVEGFGLQDQAQVLAGALVVAVLALLLEVTLTGLQRAIDPLRGARRSNQPTAAVVTTT